jgi:hypothetical protein
MSSGKGGCVTNHLNEYKRLTSVSRVCYNNKCPEESSYLRLTSSSRRKPKDTSRLPVAWLLRAFCWVFISPVGWCSPNLCSALSNLYLLGPVVRAGGIYRMRAVHDSLKFYRSKIEDSANSSSRSRRPYGTLRGAAGVRNADYIHSSDNKGCGDKHHSLYVPVRAFRPGNAILALAPRARHQFAFLSQDCSVAPPQPAPPSEPAAQGESG